MKRIKREISLLFLATINIWIYYIGSVILNPVHPYEVFWTATFLLSFLVFPLILFIIIPYLSGYFILKKLNVSYLRARTFIYGTLSFFMLMGLFMAHTGVNNYLVVSKLLPNGVNNQIEVLILELEEEMDMEIEIIETSVGYSYHHNINASLLSGTTSELSLWISYKIPGLPVNCGKPDGCQFFYVERYDIKTGEIISIGNSIDSHEEKWVNLISGEYRKQGNVEGYLIFFDKTDYYNPVLRIQEKNADLDYAIKIDDSRPNLIIGTLVSGDEFLRGKTVTLKKDEQGNLQVVIENDEMILWKKKARELIPSFSIFISLPDVHA